MEGVDLLRRGVHFHVAFSRFQIHRSIYPSLQASSTELPRGVSLSDPSRFREQEMPKILYVFWMLQAVSCN